MNRLECGILSGWAQIIQKKVFYGVKPFFLVLKSHGINKIRTPNEHVWCTTELSRWSFNHSIGRTHSWRFFFFFFLQYSAVRYGFYFWGNCAVRCGAVFLVNGAVRCELCQKSCDAVRYPVNSCPTVRISVPLVENRCTGGLNRSHTVQKPCGSWLHSKVTRDHVYTGIT